MRLNIIHTNDIHGHLEHWPVIAKFIQERKLAHQTNGEYCLVVDIGDAMDSVHPLVEATNGQVMVDLFNQVGYDFVTLGNNEGLNFTQNELGKRYHSANFEVTIANLLNDQTNRTPAWASPYYIEEIGPVKIAFIGLTAPYQTYQLNHYHVLDPIKTLGERLEELLKKQVDLVVVLSHLGLEVDRQMAELFPDIGLIIGGHTHHVLLDGEWVSQTLLAAAGKFGDFVGEITLEFDPESNHWDRVAKVYDISHLAEMYGIDMGNEEYYKQGQIALENHQIATTPNNYLALDLQSEFSFIRLALEAICWYSKVDLAFLNSGLFLSDLSEGVVTERDLHEALPHPMHLALLTMTGYQLIELLQEIEDQAEDLQFMMINGLGFRGKIFGEIIFKGIHFNYHEQQWYVHQEALQFEKVYHLVTVDHLWFLPFFPSIDRYANPQLIFPDFLRHVVAKYLTFLDDERLL